MVKRSIIKAREVSIEDPKANAEKIFDMRDVSESTRADYKYRIGDFLSFIQEHGINRNSYLEYKKHLTGRTDWSVATKDKYLTAAKIFLKELNRQGMLPADLTQNIKGFQQSKKHRKDGLNDKEIALLVKKIGRLPNTPKNTRLKALFSLFALQGLRQIEVVRLDVADLDLVSKRAFVQGKGKDDKDPINLHPKTVEALKGYLKTNKVRSGPLFQSRSNNSMNKRITTRGIRLIVKNILNELGIEKSTHGFRHYFTSKLIRSYKGDLLNVATHTRHESIETLQVYFDKIEKDANLPKYYKAFKGVSFNGKQA